MNRPAARYQTALIIGLVVFAAITLVRPIFPRDQALQHIPTALSVIALYASRYRCRLTDLSATLIVAFVALHVLGARWVYSNVPYDAWCEALFGADITERMGLSRNHYDRFVHGCFGLLITAPVYEVLTRYVQAHRAWRLVLAVSIILALSMVYELAEWALAVGVASDVADRYLGQQGDIWDGQKDMALASLGAVAAALLVALRRWEAR